MTLKTLKQGLGEAGAYLGSSVVGDTLYEVLKAMIQGQPTSLSASQATPATGLAAAQLLAADMFVCCLYMYLGTTGVGGTTTIQVMRNGTVIDSLSIPSTDPNGTQKTLDINVEVQQGERVSLNVSAIGTGAANLVATLSLSAVRVE